MSDRADAHIHLFEKGYRGSFTARPGVRLEEADVYASLAAEHGVKQALVVGYEGEAWAKGNSAYIAGLAKRHTWIRPLAYVHSGTPLTTADLSALSEQGFVGISVYVLRDADLQWLVSGTDEVWSWLARHHWMVSLNTRCERLSGWRLILERHPGLRLLVSHLALPPRVAMPPSAREARAALAELLHLARYPGTHVKLSGFYAISDPGHAYPHRAAWPYVKALIESFQPSRLLWGSDFSPSLDSVSFPQTIGVFAEMPFLGPEDLEAIEGLNLLRLLDEIQTPS